MKPELLAPAGNIDSFHAAIDAGADAVYLGIDGCFNARLRAKNFTVRDLSALLPYSRSRGVKIYVTLNTLIKQSEIRTALNILYQLDQLSVDAVIIADIGLMGLASTRFPKLRLHGSTQASVHNGYGAEFLKTLGIRRVVLARELSLGEIRETVRRSPIETEVFIHGALCYSISGQCLASSFIGGASGNRGKCTQVCRRRFKCKGIDDHVNALERYGGYFFSPHDLQAATSIRKLIDAGVTSFKIEGRMKGAEYVHTAVKAYRRIIDEPDDINGAVKELRYDFGREKTSFFINGRYGETPIDPSRPSGTGILVGTIVERGDTSFVSSTRFIDDDMAISPGDRIRVQPQSGFEGTACKVVKCDTLSNGNIAVTVSPPVQCAVGDHVFLIGKAGISKKSSSVSIPGSSVHIKAACPNAARVANSLTPTTINTSNITGGLKPPTANTRKIWVKVDNTGWLDVLTAAPCQHLIFDADAGEINKLLDDQAAMKTWRSRISVSLPIFIDETNLKFWRTIADKCLSDGIDSFTLSNPGHFALVKNARQLTADAPLWCVNRFTQKELASRGVGRFVYSYEDEYLNIRDTASPAGIIPVYGKPPLFISRMPPAVKRGVELTDPHGNTFAVHEKNGLYYTLPTTPMCLFAKREKLSSCGIENFLIDLSFHEPSYELIDRLISNFRTGTKPEGATIFNFKAGLH